MPRSFPILSDSTQSEMLSTISKNRFLANIIVPAHLSGPRNMAKASEDVSVIIGQVVPSFSHDTRIDLPFE